MLAYLCLHVRLGQPSELPNGDVDDSEFLPHANDPALLIVHDEELLPAVHKDEVTPCFVGLPGNDLGGYDNEAPAVGVNSVSSGDGTLHNAAVDASNFKSGDLTIAIEHNLRD